jgi:hypothetical protein
MNTPLIIPDIAPTLSPKINPIAHTIANVRFGTLPKNDRQVTCKTAEINIKTVKHAEYIAI